MFNVVLYYAVPPCIYKPGRYNPGRYRPGPYKPGRCKENIVFKKVEIPCAKPGTKPRRGTNIEEEGNDIERI